MLKYSRQLLEILCDKYVCGTFFKFDPALESLRRRTVEFSRPLIFVNPEYYCGYVALCSLFRIRFKKNYHPLCDHIAYGYDFTRNLFDL